jgi:hypothetical protein
MIPTIARRPPTNTAPDFTRPHCTAAHRRIAAMLPAGLPLPTIAALFGLQDDAKPTKFPRLQGFEP